VAGSAVEPTAPPRSLTRVVRDAFLATHDGWSTDEVLVDDRLNRAFLARCRQELPGVGPAECNLALLNLRKTGQLGAVVTRRRPEAHDAYQHAAEIAARWMFDKHGLTLDQVLCDPQGRQEFDQQARAVGTQASAYQLRKAALSLRKARQLRPELVVRISDWGRRIDAFSTAQIRENPRLVPQRPGVYLFRDAAGYLYIGQSVDLRDRVVKHLDESDRQSLTAYLRGHSDGGAITVELHSFDPDSKARETLVRRAYESELIRSRQPRLNLQP